MNRFNVGLSLAVLSLAAGCSEPASEPDIRKPAPYAENFDPRAAAAAAAGGAGENVPQNTAPAVKTAPVRAPAPPKADAKPASKAAANAAPKALVPEPPAIKPLPVDDPPTRPAIQFSDVHSEPPRQVEQPVREAPRAVATITPSLEQTRPVEPPPRAVIPPPPPPARPVTSEPLPVAAVEIPRPPTPAPPIPVRPVGPVGDEPPRIARAANTSNPMPVPVAPPVARQITIPSGTLIPIRMVDSVDSKTDRTGQTYTATVDEAVVVRGEVVIPKNADVLVKMTSLRQAGAVTGVTTLQLQLDRITVDRKTYTIETNIHEQRGASQTQETTRNGGLGAGVGAIIGAIAGGKKGAAIGAGVGGGAGVATAAATKDSVRVPSESRLTFRLERPLQITVTDRR